MRLLATRDMESPARSKPSADVNFLSRGRMRSFLSPCKRSLQNQSLVASAQRRETQSDKLLESTRAQLLKQDCSDTLRSWPDAISVNMSSFR